MSADVAACVGIAAVLAGPTLGYALTEFVALCCGARAALRSRRAP
jgi:hypothetical protein